MSEFKVRDAVAFLTLSVPPVNALDECALQELTHNLDAREIAVERAQSICLINRITPASELVTLSGTLAKLAAGKPRKAMLHAKEALRGDPAHNWANREDREIASFRAVWGGPEWQRGIDELFRKDRTKSKQVTRPSNELDGPPMESSYI